MSKNVQTTVTYTCDICNKEFNSDTELAFRSDEIVSHTGIMRIPILFYSDQTDGSPCKPYWSWITTPDLCQECAKKMFPAHAIGCQGYDNIYFGGETNE